MNEDKDLLFQPYAHDYQRFGRLPTYAQRFGVDERNEEEILLETRRRFRRKTDAFAETLLPSVNEVYPVLPNGRQ